MTKQPLGQTREQQAERFYKAALDNYPGSILIIDQHANIIYANDMTAKMLGVSKEWLLNTNMYDVVHSGIASQSGGLKVLESNEPALCYIYNKQKEGMYIESIPHRDQDGKIEAVFTYSQDESYITKYTEYMQKEKVRILSSTQFISSDFNPSPSIIAESPVMRHVLEMAKHIAPSSGTVSLYGDSGVGKEVVARYIHDNSRRKNQIFLPINCSAIPAELAESEFFGYERGAFTGARAAGKSGFFELANGGTLFLDEVGELPLSLQGKLLRVLESGELTRVGGDRVIQVDTRIICATNRNLRQMVRQKEFREDLFFRLDVIPLVIPPLRDRREDIIPLAELFLSECNRKNRYSKVFAPATLASFQRYRWPGNVRELRNIVERLAITTPHDVIVHSLDQDSERSFGEPEQQKVLPAGPLKPLKTFLHEAEREYLKQALIQTDWNVRKTAEQLGIHHSGLYRKIEAYNLVNRSNSTDCHIPFTISHRVLDTQPPK